MADEVVLLRQRLTDVGKAPEAFIRAGEEFQYDPGVIWEYVDALEARLMAYYRACAGEEHACRWSMPCDLEQGHAGKHGHQGLDARYEWDP